MCGIVGVIGASGSDLVDTMLQTVSHRGPDDTGVLEVGGAALGHARLAIQDPANGEQPMHSDRTGDCIVYNGEIYNHRTLRRKYAGDAWRTRCDTETLLWLAGSEYPPEQWLNELEGMFAFVVQGNGRTFAARDPLGIKPLYFGRRMGSLLFASEIKALVRAGVESFREFPPGHFYDSRHGFCRYFHLDTGSDARLHTATTIRDLGQRLTGSVRASLTSDVPVGAFLSGGLDSSLIVALASRLIEGPLPTFAVGMDGSEDLACAHTVAQHLRTEHEECRFTLDDAVAALPEVIWHLESFDVALVRSALPNYFLARLARQKVKVALSGEGADELFAGYAYLAHMPEARRAREMTRLTRELHHTNLQRCDRMSMAHGLEVRVPFLDDPDLLRFVFRIPQRMKIHPTNRTTKWVLRQAARSLLPEAIFERPKVKFAAGTGLGAQMATYAERTISDAQFSEEKQIRPDFALRSKEELLYYRAFADRFPARRLLDLVGRTRCV